MLPPQCRGGSSRRSIQSHGHRCRGRAAGKAGEHDPGGDRRDLPSDDAGVHRAPSAEQLRRHRRPGRVSVGVPAFDAVQARAVARLDDRTDSRSRVAEHDRKVGQVASQPETVEGGLEHEVAHHDRDVLRVAGGREVTADEPRLHPAPGESVCQSLDRPAPPRDHNGAGAGSQTDGAEQRRLDEPQQPVRFGGVGAGGRRHHREAGPGDSGDERRNHPLLRLRHVDKGDRRCIDAQLETAWAAPDQWQSRINSKHHRRMMAAARQRRRRECTGGAAHVR